MAGLTASIAELHKEADASASALKAVKDPLREVGAAPGELLGPRSVGAASVPPGS